MESFKDLEGCTIRKIELIYYDSDNKKQIETVKRSVFNNKTGDLETSFNLLSQDYEGINFYVDSPDNVPMICTLEHLQECCERVSIESIVGDLWKLIGEEIILAEEAMNHFDDFGVSGQDELIRWTFYRIRTKRSNDAIIRWYGESSEWYSVEVNVEWKEWYDFERSNARLRNIKSDELREVFKSHRSWVDSKGEEGKRADLTKADLRWIRLCEEHYFKHVGLQGADLTGSYITDLTKQEFLDLVIIDEHTILTDVKFKEE